MRRMALGVAVVWILTHLAIGALLGAGAGLYVRWMMQQCNPACPLQ